ncbi:unnamed protein product [Aspergillus oryzae]|uniref:WD repeat-containing protein JIP5 n=2 Tax=Aspergillus oryzae TaxID=5062 RepID=A0AAN5BW19_ASPOZ|nr:unnamed protein product [Aspergillus oryzae]GMF84733.1 unnamed protein product [Aspergillus oryzae]GMG03387.1 unnamed protein product [Aspergillus oryzae]GMG27350.1 unnamed protein product [Aspergillus oryzae]GMG43742.1 unnamed protein product [Aspergillus oryzae var. brunneus]
MFDTVCTLPLSADLFAQAIHPKEPIVSVGLASGHVETFRLPSDEVDSDDDQASTSSSRNGRGHIDTMWRTRRHKGSCRCLTFGIDGESLYSAGTDGLVKAAKAETGVSHHPHDDYISSITPLPASDTSTSGFSKQWVSTGGTTLAVTDLRRGVMVRSEDQEEELISSVYVGGLATTGTSRGEKVIVGGSSGVLTLWEKGAWDDQDERIYVQRSGGEGESLETLAMVPDELGRGKMVAVGLGSGGVKFVRIGPNKVVSEVTHDETEGVVGLGFDVEGRMVSGGGQVVKVWHEAVGSGANGASAGEKHMLGDSDEDSDDDDNDDSDDSDGERRRADEAKRKRKKGKGKDRSGGQHVMAFYDLD